MTLITGSIPHSIEEERQHLRNLAKKITKVPKTITIPTEYMV